MAILNRSLLEEISYAHPFRRYQRLALQAFEETRECGQTSSYLVLPPGAGKTVLGLEIARRLGRHSLVLAPNTAVQAQWLLQWKDFQPPLVRASAQPFQEPLTVLTYQALCRLDAGNESLEEHARALWRQDLERTTGLSTERAEIELERIADSNNKQYEIEIASYRREARVLISRGGRRDDLLALLHRNGRQLIEHMKHSGPWTLILDECHHLLHMWGFLTRAIVEELEGNVFVVGLTATPPSDMDAREAELYRRLFGGADFEVPTPAVVKEGDLAPYQDLAYLTYPLPHEIDFIRSRHVRFQELLLRLLDLDFATIPFLHWFRLRVEERRSQDGVQISWRRFALDQPDLAHAALRFIYEEGMQPPEGARLQEEDRRPPTADDWVVLLEDYCHACLRASDDPRDRRAWEEIRQALPPLGYALTHHGIRKSGSPIDRVLSLSGSKARAAIEILDAEAGVLGDQLRALVVCDYEVAGSEGPARLRGVLDPEAGSAALLLHTLVAPGAADYLHPILVTGQTVACSRATALDLIEWLQRQIPQLRGSIATTQVFESGVDGRHIAWDDVVTLQPAGGWWQPRHYIPLLTHYFEEGRSRCLVGTRALLGEGWDAQRVNVLVDLTAATTLTSVHQLRGRSLRLDPSMPAKVADNWDVVCVAPEYPKGLVDYARFVRKHDRYYGVTREGAIETGVSHLHPALSPYAPPDPFEPFNLDMLRRVSERERVRDLWKIGTPYANREVQTVRVRMAHRASPAAIRLPETGPGKHRSGPWTRLGETIKAELGGTGPSDSLDDMARALAEALAATGGIGQDLGAGSVRVVTEANGYYRCSLLGATAEESRVFAESLDELLAPLSNPRYVIPRYIDEPATSAISALRLRWQRIRAGRIGGAVVYHAIPTYLAANKQRATAFARAWNHHVSAGMPLFRSDPVVKGILEVQGGESLFEVSTQMRSVWT